jgi:hypothetical protein
MSAGISKGILTRELVPRAYPVGATITFPPTFSIVAFGRGSIVGARRRGRGAGLRPRHPKAFARDASVEGRRVEEATNLRPVSEPGE